MEKFPFERLQNIMKIEGWSQNDVAELGETSKQSVSRYVNNKRDLDFDFVFNIQTKTGYSSIWILKGIGPMKVPVELRMPEIEQKFFEKIDQERAVLRKLDKFPNSLEFLERVGNLKLLEFEQLKTYLERMFP
ncbi:DNA-binding helix-turn-helix protein [Leptospira interrogans serovar Grippotyphosa str. 2006006986]|uniref:helix-turn-helix domain-containing protein n=1 Tax=Leptospira interrogans TaxID=173 RepID=UPI0002925C7A|nr:helix-turn-helix transcriptional regulator [Leptospira interrogans]EKO89170.1 DNA-binding helix-turn-helix protein [Leptospira interrogans serovar Grippotyphosa str. Andaman]EKP83640.1 DNA-binding helix-turn-helix protein [Leptospira interrogans serovar Grippotyphosa str. 2006006986]EMN54820.1 DNA-binding helix-turn-helix protein [Leptospira interrogans serovar Autumnalis str. LP101]EMN79810.1 DNA-binding helix-turn-helix protein [Leptospira interrogans serovar Grippotyphosa str. UI 12764]U